jgi:hypothetical protein
MPNHPSHRPRQSREKAAKRHQLGRRWAEGPLIVPSVKKSTDEQQLGNFYFF